MLDIMVGSWCEDGPYLQDPLLLSILKSEWLGKIMSIKLEIK